MKIEVEFLFDNQLIAGVEKLIRESKKSLLIVSPFIDLDARIRDALNEKKEKHDFELNVLFGKNEANYFRSIKKDSLDFLKQFPDIEIRYNERLHAKFYQNDFTFIMTSLNLYDYSLANNIEVGVRSEYSAKGLIGKAVDATADLLDQGINQIKQDVLGIKKGIHPIEKFQIIFESSELLYKTEPVVNSQTGLKGLIGRKKLNGFKVLTNRIDSIADANEKTGKSVADMTTTIITTTSQTVITETKCSSASQIAKNCKLQAREIITLMENKGYIKNGQITEAGRLKGLKLKKYMGNEYVAYPENLDEFKELF